ncbi:MAG: hypothetical protein RL226_649 [Bacteroidota bacterium]|jgi:hypothetical protein
MKLFIFSVLSLFSLVFVPSTDEQLDDADTIAITKANFLFQFASFNDWPEERKKGSFKIGVVGNDNLYKEMVEKYASKAVGSQALEVFRMDKISPGQFFHIIYIDGVATANLPAIVKTVGSDPTLIVANGRDVLQKGAAISFVPVDGMVRYAINADEVGKRKLTIGSRIQLWAIN